MTINAATTTVYARVDLASRRITSLSDVLLTSTPERPVFVVSANDPNITHYIVEDDQVHPSGISVRVADAAEITDIDAETSARVTSATTSAKYAKAFELKKLYDEQFIRRFRTKGFYTTTETLAALSYEGTDPDGTMVATKALAVNVNTWYNEWRHGETQNAIDAMFAAADMGDPIDEDLRSAINDTLDNFLTARGIDITIYCR